LDVEVNVNMGAGDIVDASLRAFVVRDFSVLVFEGVIILRHDNEVDAGRIFDCEGDIVAYLPKVLPEQLKTENTNRIIPASKARKCLISIFVCPGPHFSLFLLSFNLYRWSRETD